MASATPTELGCTFNILEDEPCNPLDLQRTTATTPLVLSELSIDNFQNQRFPCPRDRVISPIDPATVTSIGNDSVTSGHHHLKPISPEAPATASRLQRPVTSLGSAFTLQDGIASHLAPNAGQPQVSTPVTKDQHHPLLAAVTANYNIQDQVEKNLAGQFEWLMSSPAANGTTSTGSRPSTGSGVLYGCNLLRKSSMSSQYNEADYSPADSFTFIATPLSTDFIHTKQMNSLGQATEVATLSPLCTPPAYEETEMHIPEIIEAVESTFSPVLSSQRSASLLGTPSPSGSFSIPRIEDSLEEIDRLEDELEAINSATRFKGLSGSARANLQAASASPSTAQAAKALKRTSMINLTPQGGGARGKAGEERHPSLRRSTSLSLRQKDASPSHKPSPKAGPSPSHQKPEGHGTASTRPPTFKSAKVPTVPKFELPGEVVARRLKEQREARKLQAEAAQKAMASPAKPRTLTKPCFELPGEAISRRKREEREAKLKAQEEEERRRREFKARPMRPNVPPTTVPRDTISSRVRTSQAASQQNKSAISTTPKGERTINTIPAPSPQPRNRNSIISSAAVTSITTKPGIISSAEASQKALRRKSTMFETLQESRVRERQEKEQTFKSAREQAAERSRIASREWAEKQRRKESSQ